MEQLIERGPDEIAGLSVQIFKFAMQMEREGFLWADTKSVVRSLGPMSTDTSPNASIHRLEQSPFRFPRPPDKMGSLSFLFRPNIAVDQTSQVTLSGWRWPICM